MSASQQDRQQAREEQRFAWEQDRVLREQQRLEWSKRNLERQQKTFDKSTPYQQQKFARDQDRLLREQQRLAWSQRRLERQQAKMAAKPPGPAKAGPMGGPNAPKAYLRTGPWGLGPKIPYAKFPPRYVPKYGAKPPDWKPPKPWEAKPMKPNAGVKPAAAKPAKPSKLDNRGRQRDQEHLLQVPGAKPAQRATSAEPRFERMPIAQGRERASSDSRPMGANPYIPPPMMMKPKQQLPYRAARPPKWAQPRKSHRYPRPLSPPASVYNVHLTQLTHFQSTTQITTYFNNMPTTQRTQYYQALNSSSATQTFSTLSVSAQEAAYRRFRKNDPHNAFSKQRAGDFVFAGKDAVNQPAKSDSKGTLEALSGIATVGKFIIEQVQAWKEAKEDSEMDELSKQIEAIEAKIKQNERDIKLEEMKSKLVELEERAQVPSEVTNSDIEAWVLIDTEDEELYQAPDEAFDNDLGDDEDEKEFQEVYEDGFADGYAQAMADMGYEFEGDDDDDDAKSDISNYSNKSDRRGSNVSNHSRLRSRSRSRAGSDVGLQPALSEEPRYSPPQQELPRDWTQHQDASGQAYYIHLPTGSTQWEYPTESVPLQYQVQTTGRAKSNTPCL